MILLKLDKAVSCNMILGNKCDKFALDELVLMTCKQASDT